MKFYVYENGLQILKYLDSTILDKKGSNSLPNGVNSFYIHYSALKMHDYASSPYSTFMNQLRNRDIFPKIQPQDADYFLVPIGIVIPRRIMEPQPHIDYIIKEMCNQLEFFEEHRAKHIFFFLGDSFRPIDYLRQSIVFQTSCNKKNSIRCLHYSSPITNKCKKDIVNAKWDIGFQGCNTHAMRAEIQNLIPVYKNNGFKCIYMHQCWFNKFNQLPRPTPEMESQAIEVMNDSKLILCPRGAGLNSIRFFEVLSYGRIPILITDNSSLPLRKSIDYGKFVIKVPENDLALLPKYVNNWLKNNDIVQASYLTKSIWDKYFADSCFYNMIVDSLKECYHYPIYY